jgi:hypothetical protein
MKSEKLNGFKEIMKNAMIENFERDGFLTPIVFFLKDDQPLISMIPPDFINTSEGKNMLSEMIKNFCLQPNVFAAGLILEANGAKMEKDTELSKLVMSGDIRVSELKEKLDIIVMIFSTPESDELVAFEVDCKNNKVCDEFGGGEASAIGGTFTKFFNWNRN